MIRIYIILMDLPMSKKGCISFEMLNLKSLSWYFQLCVVRLLIVKVPSSRTSPLLHSISPFAEKERKKKYALVGLTEWLTSMMFVIVVLY